MAGAGAAGAAAGLGLGARGLPDPPPPASTMVIRVGAIGIGPADATRRTEARIGRTGAPPPVTKLAVCMGAVLATSVEPVLRSARESLPRSPATASFWASGTETSRVAVLGVAGLLEARSAFRSTPSTRMFWITTSETKLRLGPSGVRSRISTTSTRSPGSAWPPTPVTSVTLMV